MIVNFYLYGLFTINLRMNIEGFKPAEDNNYSTVTFSQHIVPRSVLTGMSGW